VAIRRAGSGGIAPPVEGYLDVLARIDEILPDRGAILA
jgi:hypothetical protein